MLPASGHLTFLATGVPMPTIADLKPDARNARKHTPRNVGAIESSIRRDGFGRSIVSAKDGTIIAGNATVEAAMAAGLVKVRVVESTGDEVIDVRRIDVEPGSQTFHELAISDNRTAELADGWIGPVLAALAADGLIDRTRHWDEDEWQETLARFAEEPSVGLTDPDDVPEPPAEPITQPGDLWMLGRHRLGCLDAYDVLSMDCVLGGERPAAIYTDPPYGMDLDTDYSSMVGPTSITSRMVKTGGTYQPIIGDSEPFDPAGLMSQFSDVGEQFWWGADYYAERIPNRIDGSLIVWDKRVEESLDARFGSCFEIVWSKKRHKREIARIQWAGFFGMQNEDTDRRVHPTQKPVALAEWFLTRYSTANDLILDLFGGSGSTLIACEQTERRCAMMEIDPIYCDVIVNRWQDFTGQRAVLVTAHAEAAD